VGKAQQGVAAGQRYRVAGSSLSVWEVVKVIKHTGSSLEHVRLVRVGERTEAKTVSLSVLRDRRFFERV
jgi:hypothetical protein